LATLIRERLDGTYFEPFLGGGAVFFELAPRRAELSDVNLELIDTYREVKRSPSTLVTRLRRLAVSQVQYERMRRALPSTREGRATRFLYLNRNAFGGLYRVNARGHFNVPYSGGRRGHSILWRRNLLLNAAAALRVARLSAHDFSWAFGRASAGDVIYCDPTYTLAHNNNGFVRYNERNFSWRDQERLAACARAARLQGVTVLISSAMHSSLLALHTSARVFIQERFSGVSRKVTGRRRVQECVFIYD
jgi:DNA adenine methylase